MSPLNLSRVLTGFRIRFHLIQIDVGMAEAGELLAAAEVSVVEGRRWHEASKLALDQFSQLQRRSILQPRAEDLNPDRQAFRR